MRIEYDREADAVYIELKEKPYAYGEDLDLERRIDYSKDGEPIGIELTCISTGVDLAEIPNAEQIAEALKKYDIRTYSSELSS